MASGSTIRAGQAYVELATKSDLLSPGLKAAEARLKLAASVADGESGAALRRGSGRKKVMAEIAEAFEWAAGTA